MATSSDVTLTTVPDQYMSASSKLMDYDRMWHEPNYYRI